jgi:hypothetical protein
MKGERGLESHQQAVVPGADVIEPVGLDGEKSQPPEATRGHRRSSHRSLT